MREPRPGISICLAALLLSWLDLGYAFACSDHFIQLEQYVIVQGKLKVQRWPSCSRISYKFTDAEPLTGAKSAVRDGFASWQSLSGAYKIEECFPGTLICSDVTFETVSWSYTQGDLGARTPIYEDASQSRYAGFKVEFNFVDHVPNTWSTACTPNDGKFSVKATAVHEFGHVLGLADLCTDATNCQGRWDCGTVMMPLTPGWCREVPGTMDTEAIVDMYNNTAGYLVGDFPSTAALACDFGPAALVADFAYENGMATWTVEHEWRTREYLIEGFDLPEGPTTHLASTGPGAKSHDVPIDAKSYRWLRLVEVDEQGKRTPMAVCSTSRSPQGPAIVPTIKIEPRHKSSESNALSKHRAVMNSEPSCVVYTVPSLVSVMQDEFAEYWNARGHSVLVVAVPLSSEEDDVRGWLKDDINARAAEGVSSFHLVGDWDDDCESPLWQATPFWQSRYNSLVALNDIPSEPVSSVPPFLMPDALGDDDNTARHVPYVYSDRPYSDVDNDGIPDVVVTRWPFRASDEVLAACGNMKSFDEHELNADGPLKVSFLVDDASGDATGLTATQMSDLLIAMLGSGLNGETVTRLLSSSYPSSESRNVATITHLNLALPDVVGMLCGTMVSDWRRPGNFLLNETTGGAWSTLWDMSQVTPDWFVRMVIGTSCESGKWIPLGANIVNGVPMVAGKTFWDVAMYLKFLTTPDRGTISWIGAATGTYQGGNYIVQRFLLEELYANPYRPMGTSWLAAMRRAYTYCQDFPDYIPTLDSYAFLGNPLSSFQPPVFLASPSSGEVLNGIVSISGSVSALEWVSGPSAELDSFAVEWRPNDQQEWNQYGVTYVVPRNSGVQNSTVATWDTGVVSSGEYVLRVITYLGSDTYQVNHAVNVQHRSTTVGVGESFASLWDAVNWAAAGDTIRVSTGIYPNTQANQTIVVDKTVHIVGTGSDVEIQPFGNAPMMHVPARSYPVTVDGITFRRPTPNYSSDSFGVTIWDAPVIFRNCRFLDLRSSFGCAVSASGKANVVLDRCEFIGLERSGNYLGSAVSMGATINGKPTGAFVDCAFRDCNVPAVHIGYEESNPLQGTEPKPYFERCRFEGNYAGDCLVAISNSLRTINFFGCVFVDNVIFPWSGAPTAPIYCDNAKIWVDNCTIANNKRVPDCCFGPVGAVAIETTGSSPVEIDDSIIAFNDGPAVFDANGATPTSVIMSRTVLFANTPYAAAKTDAQWAAQGNQVFSDENPAFCNAAAGDYRLFAFSPAVAGPQGEPGPHFSATVGALEMGCLPSASILVSTTDGQNDITGVLVTCPQGETGSDPLIFEIDFLDPVMTRAIEPGELLIKPPYSPRGIWSASPIVASGSANSTNGYKMTTQHAYLSGFGSDASVPDTLAVYLNGYPLEQEVTFLRRSPDTKSAGAPGPPPCSGDANCPDGKVTNSDLSWFFTHYPTSGNPSAPYFAGCDYKYPPNLITSPDFNYFVTHFVGEGHKYPHLNDPLLQTVGTEATLPTQITLAFTEEYATAFSRRFYVDLALEDCANENWCLFALRTNRDDLAFSSWQPTAWAAGSVPFARVETENGEELVFGVIMINDSGENSRHLGQLAFDVHGTEPLAISDDQFVLTIGEIGLPSDSPTGESLTFARMDGVFGRRLNAHVDQVFHNRLEQNFPNPFNPQTALAYSLKDASDVSLTIYDVAGRRVRDLVNERRAPGAYRVVWDGRDGNGAQVASGVYFYKLVAEAFVDTKKMVMLK